MKKCIVLCADDYGQAPEISEGIIQLLNQQRLSAVSCMVNTDYWVQQASSLIPFHEQADIGLHFNLTHGMPLSAEYKNRHGNEFSSVGKVMFRAYMRLFSQQAIEAELHAQIDQFEEALGFLPDHIDGHQHIHQFPVIRDAMIKVYDQRLRARNTYIRLISGPPPLREIFTHFKKMIIHAAGAKAMAKLLADNKIPHNQSFSGIYAFDLANDYPEFFPQFLQAVNDNGLIMCHPGLLAAGAQDSIAEARIKEYGYLSGDQFIADCRANSVAIKRFKCSDNLL